MLNDTRLPHPLAQGAVATIADQRATTPLVCRNELFTGLAAIGFINGISERVSTAVEGAGLAAALVSTFDISLIVWAAWAISRC